MSLAVSLSAGLALAVWAYLIFLHGDFWRADQRIGTGSVKPLPQWAEVVAVVPARDEADVIGRTVASLLAQDYPQPISVILVDDGSRDGTADAARAAAAAAPDRLIVVDGKPIEPGWTGKVWAMAQGVAVADRAFADARYILFSDADIEHEPTNLRRLVARAECDGCDLVSVMVMLSTGGIWEWLLIPPFVFFFQMLYPFAHVNRGRRAAAAGGCMLVRRKMLAAAGGMASIRGALIDDCALARCIRAAGGRLWLGLSTATHSARAYGGLSGVWNMVARSAYTQLDHSPWWLAGTVVGMILIYLVPPVAFLAFPLTGNAVAALGGALGVALMVGVYRPTVRLYGQPAAAALFLPAAAALYTAMTIDSALRHWRGVGGGWKGRVYSR